MTITTQFTPVPESNTTTERRRHPGPQRHLDARLASAIRAGKEATGLSWRALAAETGISRAHLNNLSLGKRVPSRQTAQVLIDALNLDRDIADELRAVAAPPWWERLDRDR
jgi:ribosome-binding protein aMBF1 (putative translation factor)